MLLIGTDDNPVTFLQQLCFSLEHKLHFAANDIGYLFMWMLMRRDDRIGFEIKKGYHRLIAAGRPEINAR